MYKRFTFLKFYILAPPKLFAGSKTMNACNWNADFTTNNCTFEITSKPKATYVTVEIGKFISYLKISSNFFFETLKVLVFDCDQV